MNAVDNGEAPMGSSLRRIRSVRAWTTKALVRDTGVRLKRTVDELYPADLAAAYALHSRMGAIRNVAIRVERDKARRDAEKNHELLIACAELALVAKWPRDLMLRLMRITNAMGGLLWGLRDPILKPINPIPGRKSLSFDSWRMNCVLAVEAKRRLDGSSADDARRSFESELHEFIDLTRNSAKWKILFPSRRSSKYPSEIDRRCASLAEWAKPRVLASITRSMQREFEILKNCILSLDANREYAYKDAFVRALLDAKSLLAAQG